MDRNKASNCFPARHTQNDPTCKMTKVVFMYLGGLVLHSTKFMTIHDACRLEKMSWEFQ